MGDRKSDCKSGDGGGVWRGDVWGGREGHRCSDRLNNNKTSNLPTLTQNYSQF